MAIDFVKVLNEPHRWALEHKAKGGLVMGCYTAMVPEELMWACGVLPIQFLMSPGPYDEASVHLPPYACECAKSILEGYHNGSYPYLDGVMVSHVCETIRGLAGILSVQYPDHFFHVLSAPAANDEGARQFLKDEILSLARKLEQMGAAPLTSESLETAISEYNENRMLMKNLYELRGNNPRAVSPEQVMAAVLSSGIMPKKDHNRMLKEFLKDISEDTKGSGTRVILSGLLFEKELGLESDLLPILKDAGALVVWDDLAVGMRYSANPVDENREMDPRDRLAAHLLGPQPAPIRSPSKRKASELLKAAHYYKGEGFIFLIPKYCDPILFDIPTLMEILKEKGYPTLCLEISGSLPSGHLRTRVEAFLEMIAGSY